MKMKFYTYTIFILFLLPETKKILQMRFYLPEIDHFMFFLEKGLNLISRMNLFGIYNIKDLRQIYISANDFDNVFNFFDPVGFVKVTYLPEIRIYVQNKTFQNMVNHAEESFFYVSQS